jgi:hypothetical protein
MTLISDIAAIRADGTKTDREKNVAIYALKGTALLDVILNGKPSPNPLPPLINRTFTLNGVTIRVNTASTYTKTGADGVAVPILFVDVTLNSTVTHQVHITNPPILPRVITGVEKQDLIQAASEILAGLPLT